MTKLTEAQIQTHLTDLPDWSQLNDEIQRTYQFEDFAAAMEFVNKVAEAAEAVQHHPDILIRYNKVTLSITTHDAGGITDKDISLARQTDAVYAP